MSFGMIPFLSKSLADFIFSNGLLHNQQIRLFLNHHKNNPHYPRTDNLRNSYIPYFNTVGSTVTGGIEITGQNMFDYGQRSKISGESYIEKFYFNPSATWHGGDYHGGYGVMAGFSAYSEMVNFYRDTVKDFRKRYGI